MTLFAHYDPSSQHPHQGEPGVQVRDAMRDDLGRIAELIHQRNGGGMARHLSGVSDHFDSGRERIAVAEVRGKVIGFGKLGILEPPPNPPADHIPRGWYLTGVIVDPEFRRRGAARLLTCYRLDWLFERSDEVFYFANAGNHASIALHEKLGFMEIARNITAPGSGFIGGVGMLFRLTSEGYSDIIRAAAL